MLLQTLSTFIILHQSIFIIRPNNIYRTKWEKEINRKNNSHSPRGVHLVFFHHPYLNCMIRVILSIYTEKFSINPQTTLQTTTVRISRQAYMKVSFLLNQMQQ